MTVVCLDSCKTIVAKNVQRPPSVTLINRPRNSMFRTDVESLRLFPHLYIRISKIGENVSIQPVANWILSDIKRCLSGQDVPWLPKKTCSEIVLGAKISDNIPVILLTFSNQ